MATNVHSELFFHAFFLSHFVFSQVKDVGPRGRLRSCTIFGGAETIGNGREVVGCWGTGKWGSPGRGGGGGKKWAR